VGFDLDMTLVDSRPVSRRALESMAGDCELDIDALMARYGLPLDAWLPAGADHAMFHLLQEEGLALAEPMPGAFAAVEAVRRSGDRVVVVTASQAAIVGDMLAAVGLRVDALHTGVWAAAKAGPLRRERCWAFVGDHASDMHAARAAGAIGVGVATGTTAPAGADVELADLTAFPAWFEEHSRATAGALRWRRRGSARR
jgi:phosphoglycolate phosphatase